MRDDKKRYSKICSGCSILMHGVISPQTQRHVIDKLKCTLKMFF